MSHKPIQLNHLSLTFPHKVCFDDFSENVLAGSRIAIIGRNGSGKSTLLKMIAGEVEPTAGSVQLPADALIGYVPQIIDDVDSLSGGQRFNASLTRALAIDPDILLLDEPTNHLDQRNRNSLMRMLRSFAGTLIVVSHDRELLRNCITTLWHIEDGRIHVFSGNYDDYISEMQLRRASLEQEVVRLNRQTKDMHHALMKEQKRAAASKSKGEKSITQRKWPTIVSSTKAGRAQETSGRKKAAIDRQKQEAIDQLANSHLSEVIIPKFSITAQSVSERMIVTISDASVGYEIDHPLVTKISLTIASHDRIAICGDNASGKTTLIKAILRDSGVFKTGDWLLPRLSEIGYLDQHYRTLNDHKTVLDTISELVPQWSHKEVRRHLNDFLFRKNEEVNAAVSQLSGGEKARLSLAQIAAKTPALLILDEITNNLDLETRAHVVQVLTQFPGALIVISHEQDFLNEIGIRDVYHLEQGELRRVQR